MPGIETSGLTESAGKKTAKSDWLLKTCLFHPESPTHAHSQTGTKNSWFRFLNRPEPLRFQTAGQGDSGSVNEIANEDVLA